MVKQAAGAGRLQGCVMALCLLASAGCASRGQTVEVASVPQPAPPVAAEAAPPAEAAAAVPALTSSAAPAEPLLCQQSEGRGRYAWLRMAHQKLEGYSCNTALWLDGMLGDTPNAEAASKAHGQLDVSGTYSQFSGTDSRVRFRVRIPLPNLERRLSAFVGRGDEESFIQDRPEAQALNDQFSSFQGNEEFLAGLGYSVPGGKRLQTSFRLGVRNLRRPGVFTQARFFYSPYADDVNLVYLRSTPFWNSNDGFGITNGVEYNRFVSPSRLLRISSSGTISEKTEGLSWVASSVLYQDLKRGRGLAPELFIRGETDEPEPLQEYGLRLTYRQPIFDEGLFARLAPGYSWPRENPDLPREGSYNVLLGLELPFGRGEK